MVTVWSGCDGYDGYDGYDGFLVGSFHFISSLLFFSHRVDNNPSYPSQPVIYTIFNYNNNNNNNNIEYKP